MPDIFLHGAEVVQINDGLRPIRTIKSSVIAVVGTAPLATADFPLNTPVLIAGPRQAAALGADGTLLDAYNAAYAQGVQTMVVVRVAVGGTDAETLSNVTGTPAAGTGVYALLNAANLTGQKPKILAAPGFTSVTAAPASPVATALVTVATRLRAIVVVDGPNTTEAAALSVIELYGSDRLYMVDPAVRVYDTATSTYVTMPASGFAAGIISRMDVTNGFWWSPSNQLVGGIVGTARPVTFGISDPETEASVNYPTTPIIFVDPIQQHHLT